MAEVDKEVVSMDLELFATSKALAVAGPRACKSVMAISLLSGGWHAVGFCTMVPKKWTKLAKPD